MSRAFCIPGIVFLAIALILSFLVSISLPFLPALDIVRTHFGSTSAGGQQGRDIGQLRLGVWSACVYDAADGSRTCLPSHHGYSIPISSTTSGGASSTIKSSWTRGLAVHPVATGVTFVAFLLSFSTHLTVTLLASIVSFLAAALTLIAFAIDIALFVLVRNAMNKLDIGANTDTAPGFWMTFVTLILLLLAGCTVCFGRRRDRMSGATTQSYPLYENKVGFFSRFRRNRA
ncbi:pali-domain-containing protein [Agrocybe pediades]|nr:pali-domain-containing protein [Agrocybe pediades]